MLFEAMPLSLRSDKRKSAHCHEDVPLSKKIAQPVPKYTQSKLMSFSSSAEKLVLSNLDKIAIEESVVRRKKDTADSKLTLDLSSDEEDDVWITKHARAQHENGVDNTNSSHVSEGEIDSFVQTHMLVDNERSGTLDCSTSIHSPEKIMGSSSRTDFLTSSNGSPSSKQPSLVLEKSRERKKSGYDRRLAESASSSLLQGGYMRRMASLNASACVTALMEPEKKNRPDKSTKPYKANSNETQLRESRKSWSFSSSDDFSAGIPSPIIGLEDLEPSRVNDLSLSPARFYGSSTSSEADTSKDSDEILGVSEPHRMYTLLALATLASAARCDLDETPYNKLGLLYNGDTIHPAARVFFTSDTDLTLPDRIIPRVVPSQEKFVRFAISKAMAQRPVGKKRKGAKVSYTHV